VGEKLAPACSFIFITDWFPGSRASALSKESIASAWRPKARRAEPTLKYDFAHCGLISEAASASTNALANWPFPKNAADRLLKRTFVQHNQKGHGRKKRETLSLIIIISI
jgi:hypothetical protein